MSEKYEKKSKLEIFQLFLLKMLIFLPKFWMNIQPCLVNLLLLPRAQVPQGDDATREASYYHHYHHHHHHHHYLEKPIRSLEGSAGFSED